MPTRVGMPCHRSKRDPRLRPEAPRRIGFRSVVRGRWPVISGLLSLVPLLLLSSCSPGYVLRAAYEEGKILWRRKPIVEELKKDGLDPAVRAKLETVLDVRTYAKEELALRVGGSYASISYVDGPVLSHLLTAVPKTEFEPYTWWFLFIGSVPYKGYFDRDDAEEEAHALERRGYDTHIRPVGAFSTLGWFDDPLLERLLRLDRVRLAEVILHELLHNTLFVKGSVDFNESLANFVGKRGAIAYFTGRHGPASPEARTARRIWRDELEFSAFLMDSVACLRAFYRADASEAEKLERRTALFEAMREAWRQQIADRPDHLHAGFGGTGLNNAALMQSYLYVNNLRLFEKLYQRTGGDLSRAVARIEAATQSGEQEPFDALAALVGGLASHTAPALPVCRISEMRREL